MYDVRELREVQTADGLHYVFANGKNRYVVFLTGIGIPNIVRSTERGYKQDGVTVVEKHLDERTISIQTLAQACGRQEYEELRDEIINAMRPNRGEPLTLRIGRVTGEWYEIDIEVEGELLASEMPAVDNLVNELFNFRAAYPIWRSADVNAVTATAEATQHWCCPYYCPDTFLHDADTITIRLGALAYAGNYKSYPTVTIEGPANALYIENLTLGAASRYIGFSLPAGETLIIEYGPGGPELTSTNGIDYSGYLTRDSFPLDVVLAPAGILDISVPCVPDGVNDIIISVGGSSIATRVTFSYRDMYIGL